MATIISRFEHTLKLALALKHDEQIALVKAVSVQLGAPLYTKVDVDKAVETAMNEFWAEVERKMKTEPGIFRVK